MEIYYHLIEAEFVHRHFTRGAVGAANTTSATTAPSAYQPGGKGDQNKYAKFPPLQRRILEVLEEMMPRHEQGVHVTAIATGLNYPASIDEIGATMEKLAEEGQIYATIDDEHFAIS
ncbi:replication factor A protein 2 [Ceratobasidium sp. 392]|nr:replication factor A protein 2 [Ceratobasidium sp. 392]